jgi:hypothetical protein
MTLSIIASGQVGRDTQFPARPHPRRTAVWTPFESVAWVVSLLLAVRRLGATPGGHRRAAAGTRVTSSVRRFLKDWWVLFAVFGGFALVTIVGVLVLSAQVPR